MQQNLEFLNHPFDLLLTSGGLVAILLHTIGNVIGRPISGGSIEKAAIGRKTMAKYLQCSECGKLAFYYDDFVGTEKPFYRRFMRYPEGETKYEPPRCFSCGGVPRLIHENIKEEKAAAKH
jgi:hypothetical protein